MLELRSVSASYGEVRALRNLNLTIAPGETVALVGRNGAGKTTTLRVVAGVMDPVRGDVLWNGESLLGRPPEERVGLGVALVPEGRGMFPGLSVEENLRMGAFWRRPGRRQLNEELGEVYDLLPRLGERRKQAAGSLSGGEQQMLAIGRALLSQPKLLLLDEPSLGLSPAMIDALYELLGQLKERGVSFILVEQFVPLALKICDRAIGLSKGEVALSGRAEDVAHEELTEIYMGGPSLEAEAKTIIGVDS
jgi:branched-chain amino acid transport system ATP-binding protein